MREKRGNKPQSQMAKELGMKQPMHARYESGMTLPSAELLFHICSKLGVSADWLLGLSDDETGRQPATVAGGGSRVNEKAKERKEA
ncbi:MAG TPA: helix-turn-helix transcriptional regulator [Kiritimatiellia bacterium]|nr:helix-turn-helix transcriptional regulator [Kiritimatiellia bacterium]